MSIRTSRMMLALRSAGRSLGLNRLIARMLPQESYEDRFWQAFEQTVRASDVVWDVGANVGLYSTKFSGLVGETGSVIAFEPSPVNRARLQENVGALRNVVVQPLALGRSAGEVKFAQGEDDLGATSRVVDKGGDGGGLLTIRMETGDSLVASGVAPGPTILKIDTEGFELDVIAGLRNSLAARSLRMVGVEVHFGILQDRGLSAAPAEIERMLEDCGLRLQWVDASHLVGLRA